MSSPRPSKFQKKFAVVIRDSDLHHNWLRYFQKRGIQKQISVNNFDDELKTIQVWELSRKDGWKIGMSYETRRIPCFYVYT